jgi:hypothetical protein
VTLANPPIETQLGQFVPQEAHIPDCGTPFVAHSQKGIIRRKLRVRKEPGWIEVHEVGERLIIADSLER